MLARRSETLACWKFAVVGIAFAILQPLSQAMAQDNAAGLQARIASARQLLQAMGADQQFDTVIEVMSVQIAGIFKQQRPANTKEIEEVFKLLTQQFRERKGEVLDMVAPLYAEKFTGEELEQLAAFYRTPVGTKLIKVLPELTQQSMMMGMAWGQRIGQEVEAEARRELKKRGIDL